MSTMSAARHREDAAHRYNANLKECPGHQLLAVLSDKWVTLVISALADGPLRYSELARIVAGASQKMLTQTLRRLEREGFVSRAVTAQVPVRVEYQLTDLGSEILPLQRQIKSWAETHIDQVAAAREAFDTENPARRGTPRQARPE